MMRFVEGLTWERIARELQCDRKSLYLWRQSPVWAEAKARILDMMKAEGPDTAWGCLMRQAQHGDVAAAKEILARTEGAVTQRQVVTDADGNSPTQPLSDGLRELARAVLAERCGVLPKPE